MFTTKKATSFVLSEGPREVYVEDIGEYVNKNQNPYIGVRFRIRKDIQQPNIGASAVLNIHLAKETTADDIALGGYQANKIYRLAECANIPENTEFSSLSELFEAIIGAPMLVTLKNRAYNGNTYTDVYVDEPSQYPLPPEVLQEINRAKLERRVAEQERANRAPAQTAAAPTAQPYGGQYRTDHYTPPAQTAAAQPSGAQAFASNPAGAQRVPF